MPTAFKKLFYAPKQELYFTTEEVETMLSRYLQWCQNRGNPPEVRHLKDIDEETIETIVWFGLQ